MYPNHNIIYLIEGNIQYFKKSYGHVDKNALWSAMTSLSYFKGFSVFRTLSLVESVEFIIRFALKLEKEKGKSCIYGKHTFYKYK